MFFAAAACGCVPNIFILRIRIRKCFLKDDEPEPTYVVMDVYQPKDFFSSLIFFVVGVAGNCLLLLLPYFDAIFLIIFLLNLVCCMRHFWETN